MKRYLTDAEYWFEVWQHIKNSGELPAHDASRPVIGLCMCSLDATRAGVIRPEQERRLNLALRQRFQNSCDAYYWPPQLVEPREKAARAMYLAAAAKERSGRE